MAYGRIEELKNKYKHDDDENLHSESIVSWQ